MVSYTQDLIISTHEGQLTATSVWLFDFSNLAVSAVSGIARIGPTSANTGNATSTGRFVGATGFYFITGASPPDAAGNARVELQAKSVIGRFEQGASLGFWNAPERNVADLFRRAGVRRYGSMPMRFDRSSSVEILH